jgi:predicted Zn-dependent protease with MMP-like domain
MPPHTVADNPDRGDPFAGSGDGAGGEPDFYAVLGLQPGASDDDVRRAFHRLAKLWHPDRYMAAPAPLRARAERRMRALTAAHEALGDPVRRHAYDRRYGHPFPSDPSVQPTSHHPTHTGSGGGHAYDASAAERNYRPPTHMGNMGNMGNPNGAGQFIGLLCCVLGLGILLYQLRYGDGTFGSYVAIGASLLLGALALWFFTVDSIPARVATRWMEGEPTAHASPGPRPSKHDHHDHHDPTKRPQQEAHEPAPTMFERLVDEAVAGVPDQFRPYMENVVVRIQPEPSADDLARLEVREGHTLFGLYQGVDLTRQGARGAGPEVITIYQGPIERYCHGDPDRIRDQVRRTVLHELAHHFGIDHEEMPDWVR